MDRSDMITLSDSNFYQKIINKYLKGKSHHFRLIMMVFRKDLGHTVPEIGVDILVKLKFHNQSIIYSFILKNVKNTNTLFSQLPFQNLIPQFVLKPAILKNVQSANKIFSGIFKKIVSMYSQAYPLFFLHGVCNVSMPDRTTSRLFNCQDKPLSPEVNVFLNRRMYKTELFRSAFFFPQANYNISLPETAHQFYNYFYKHPSTVVDVSSKSSTSLNINKTEIFPQNQSTLFYQHIFYDVSFPGTTRSILNYYDILPRGLQVMSAFFDGRMNKPEMIQNRISFIHSFANYNFSRSGTTSSILNYYDRPPVESQVIRAFFDRSINKPDIIQNWNYFIHPRVNISLSRPGIAPQPLNYFNKQHSAVVNVSLNNRTTPSIKDKRLAAEIFQNRMNQNKHLMNYNYTELEPYAASSIQNKITFKGSDNFYFHNQRKIEEEIEQIKKIVVETKKEMEQTSLSTNSAMDIKKHLDISHISNQVYEVIERKLRIEKERRGL